MIQFIAEAVKSALEGIAAAGGVVENVNFDGIEVRDLENAGFEKGEILLVDANKKAIRKVRGNDAPLLLVASSTGVLKELYLSAFMRTLFVHSEEGDHAPVLENGVQTRIKAQGSAIDLYKSKTVATAAVAGLDKQYIKVCKKQRVGIMRPAANGGRNFGHQNVYDLYLCNEDGTKLFKKDGTEYTAEEKESLGIE